MAHDLKPRGQRTIATHHGDEGRRMAEAAAHSGSVMVASWGLGLLAGRLEEAHALAEQALALARAHQERGHQVYALRLLGEIAARRAPPERDQAGDDFRQALTLAEELGMRPLVAHCHLRLGKLYGEIGRQDEARAELSAAITLYRAMGMTFWLPQVEATLAQVERQ
jgi:sugar phosphate isomerase/epimerase